MGVSWTTEQKQVIDARGCNLLVSAAAGSGKTAVLVARILALITDPARPVDIDQLLVVTFTRAAAGEMRERISQAIEERLLADPDNEHLQRQSVLLHNARISTIDGFCTYVIQNYFYRTELDPGYRIAEQGELEQLRGDVLTELLEDAYEEDSEAFLSLSEMIAPGKNDRKLEEVLLKIYDFSMASLDPAGWLANCRDACEADSEDQLMEKPWMREVLREAGRILSCAREAAGANLRLASREDCPQAYRPMAVSDLEQTEELEACGSYVELQSALQGLKLMRLAAVRTLPEGCDPEIQKQFKDNRDGLKKLLQDLQKNLFAAPVGEILAELAVIRPHMQELTRLAEEFGRRFSEKKRSGNLVDFTDLEHYALRILLEKQGEAWVRTDAAKELAGRFAEIMIDEYQDSNLLQEYLLEAVSGSEDGIENRFMVGDMKQSIYGFRMARPELFLDKYETYQPYEEYRAESRENVEAVTEAGENAGSVTGAGENAGSVTGMGKNADTEREDRKAAGSARITLGRNFRSRPEVLDFVNSVFARLMQGDLGGITYDAGAALYPGASFPEAGSRSYQAEILLLDKKAPEFDDDRSKETMLEAEAMMVAQKIRMLRQTMMVTDRASGSPRPLMYRDIVILLRAASGAAGTFARVLQSAGIPAYASSRKGYFSAGEVVTVLNYLRILDNPRQEIPFAAILRSPVCGCTDEELAVLHCAHRDQPIYEACRLYEGENLSLHTKLRSFLEVFDRIRAGLPFTPVHEVVQQVLDQTGYGAYAAAMPAGEQRAANLRMLVEKAADYEKTSYHGLFRFVRYIEQLGSYNIDYGEVNLFGEGEDTVRVMTIHKSKGLEFPVVFVSGIGSGFNMMDLNNTVLQHAKLGVGVDAVNLSRRTKTPSLLRKAIRTAAQRDQMGEELRILYVALTRAREKLILTGIADDVEKRNPEGAFTRPDSGLPVSYVRRMAGRSYLDWILEAVSQETPADLTIVQPSELGETELLLEAAGSEKLRKLREIADQAEELGAGAEEHGAAVDSPEAYALPVYHTAAHAFLQEKAAFSYQYADLAGLPAKLSVSEIKKKSIEEQMEEKGEVLYREEPVIPLIPQFILRQQEPEESPAGEQKAAEPVSQREQATEPGSQNQKERKETLQGAARGTVYHQVLEGLELTKIAGESDIRTQLSEMVRKGLLTEQEAKAVRPADLMRFVQSPIGRRMRDAAARGALVREQPFVIDIPAAEISADYKVEEPILVQGVIDAYFEEDGDYVIVDYKTDRVRSGDGQELADKYRVQLQYYRRALEQILDIRVKELYLYSTYLGREIKV